MITYQIENFCDIGDEMMDLFKIHYDEITHNKNAKKLNPDWHMYEVLTDEKKCLTYTARDDGRLVGYIVTFIYNHPHYKDTVFGQNDLLFVHPDYRGKGVMSRMITENEELLKSVFKVTVVNYHMKIDKDFSPLMEKKGLKKSEIIWEKVLR